MEWLNANTLWIADSPFVSDRRACVWAGSDSVGTGNVKLYHAATWFPDDRVFGSLVT